MSGYFSPEEFETSRARRKRLAASHNHELQLIEEAPEVSMTYRAYATAHGNSPATMLVRDRLSYRGGVMTGYIVWCSQRAREFAAEFPTKVTARGVIADANAWQEWLTAKAEQLDPRRAHQRRAR